MEAKNMPFDYGYWNHASKPFVRRVLPLIPDFYNYKTILYVGMRVKPMRMHLCPEFVQRGYIVDVLEICPSDVKDIVEWNKTYKFFRRIIEGDVREIDKLVDEKYDQIFWWHGPEYVPKKDVKPTLDKFMKIVTKVAVVGCPNWEFPYQELGPRFRNPHEIHLSNLFVKDFERWGWWVEKIGAFVWIAGRQLISWNRPVIKFV